MIKRCLRTSITLLVISGTTGDTEASVVYDKMLISPSTSSYWPVNSCRIVCCFVGTIVPFVYTVEVELPIVPMTLALGHYKASRVAPHHSTTLTGQINSIFWKCQRQSPLLLVMLHFSRRITSHWAHTSPQTLKPGQTLSTGLQEPRQITNSNSSLPYTSVRLYPRDSRCTSLLTPLQSGHTNIQEMRSL